MRNMLVQIALLGGQWFEDNWQAEVDERALKRFGTRDRNDVVFQPLTCNLERLSSNTDPEDWEWLKWIVEFVRAFRQRPLRLSDLSRRSIRKATCRKHFQASILLLPFPTIMKDFVRADLFPNFPEVYGL